MRAKHKVYQYIRIYHLLMEWFRKLVKFTNEEIAVLDDAVSSGIAESRMEAIHKAMDLLKIHLEGLKECAKNP